MSKGPRIVLNVDCDAVLVTTVGGVNVTIKCSDTTASERGEPEEPHDHPTDGEPEGPRDHPTQAALRIPVELEDLAARTRESSESLSEFIDDLNLRDGLMVELDDGGAIDSET